MAKILKILYVAAEIKPFLNHSYVSDIVRKLPQAMQEKGIEIRILVPKFGCINERTNRLHEVVRLSGMNIPVGDDEKPLIIKVASIPAAKLQVYFIDNEDYFQRKTIFHKKNGKFHNDNDERCIFFCKGVLETVIKLGWSPDIIHCNDWITSLIPLLVNTTYKENHIFNNTKSIFSIHQNPFKEKLNKKFVDKVIDEEIDKSMLTSLKSLNYNSLIKIASEYSDAIIKPKKVMNKPMEKLLSEVSSNSKIFTVDNNDEKIVDAHFKIYNEILS